MSEQKIDHPIIKVIADVITILGPISIAVVAGIAVFNAEAGTVASHVSEIVTICLGGVSSIASIVYNVVTKVKVETDAIKK